MPTFKLFNPCQPCCITPSGGCQFCGISNTEELYAHFNMVSGICADLHNACVPISCGSGNSVWSGSRIIGGNPLFVEFGGDTLFWEWGTCNDSTLSPLKIDENCGSGDKYALFLSSGLYDFSCGFDCTSNDLLEIKVDQIPCSCCQYPIPDTLCLEITKDPFSGPFDWPRECPCLIVNENGSAVGSGTKLVLNKIVGSGDLWYGIGESVLCQVPLAADFTCQFVNDDPSPYTSGFLNVYLNDVKYTAYGVSVTCPTSFSSFSAEGALKINPEQDFGSLACECRSGVFDMYLSITPTGGHVDYCRSHLETCCNGTFRRDWRNNLDASIISSPGCCLEGLDFILGSSGLIPANTFEGFTTSTPSGSCGLLSGSNRPFMRVQCSNGFTNNTIISCSGSMTTLLSGIIESCCPLQARLYFQTSTHANCCPTGIVTEVLVTE